MANKKEKNILMLINLLMYLSIIQNLNILHTNNLFKKKPKEWYNEDGENFSKQ